MNRLQLVQRTRVLAGIPGTAISTLLQTGEADRVVKWVDDAWTEIQQAHKWGFMWETATVTILAATNATAGTIPAQRYVQDATYIGTTPINYLPWDTFRNAYPTASVADGTPIAWSIRPDKALVVNAKPTTNTDLAVERYKNPTSMAADGDEPTGLPSEHHMAIVYKALLLYANFEEAGVTRATAEAEFKRHMAALGLYELPGVTFGAPLI